MTFFCQVFVRCIVKIRFSFVRCEFRKLFRKRVFGFVAMYEDKTVSEASVIIFMQRIVYFKIICG